jgi:hypothetical protein
MISHNESYDYEREFEYDSQLPPATIEYTLPGGLRVRIEPCEEHPGSYVIARPEGYMKVLDWYGQWSEGEPHDYQQCCSNRAQAKRILSKLLVQSRERQQNPDERMKKCLELFEDYLNKEYQDYLAGSNTLTPEALAKATEGATSEREKARQTVVGVLADFYHPLINTILYVAEEGMKEPSVAKVSARHTRWASNNDPVIVLTVEYSCYDPYIAWRDRIEAELCTKHKTSHLKYLGIALEIKGCDDKE